MYGRAKDEDLERRMVDLGRGKPSSDLIRLRHLCIESTNLLAQSIWPVSILQDMPGGKHLDQLMLRTQSGLRGTLNSVWAEKCRINAKSACTEQHKRARGKLFGKFKHIASVGDTPLDCGTRRLLNLPEEWSTRLSDADISALGILGCDMNFAGVLELFQKLQAGQVTSIPVLHQQALLALLEIVDSRYGCPVWKEDQSTVQLHLDFRCFLGGRTAQDALLSSLTGGLPSSNPTFATFLVSGVVARGTPLKLSADLWPDAVKTLVAGKSGDCSFTSLALEIGPHEAIVRGVLTQKPAPYTVAEASHVLADDFGYCNTSAQALVKLDAPLDPDFFEEARTWTKQQAREYLSTHGTDATPVETVLHCGRDFLAAVNGHAEHVDRLRSEIDRLYNRFHRIKHEVCRILGVAPEERIDLGMKTGNDLRLARLLEKLGMLLEQISHLKALRRGVYRTVDGIKKSWFGWLANRKAQLARRYKAVVVREDLNLLAKEKESAGYIGRTFNKMMNNGAMGQYLRAASAKLKWHGIPEVTVPAYYTSSTDVRHGVVDKRQRRSQDRFVASRDGQAWQADVHAAFTIAVYATLKPLASMGNATLAT